MSEKHKLIEVALPLQAINRESAREKSIRHAFDEKTNRYIGLAAAEHPPVVLDPASVLVKPETAARKMEDDRKAGGEATSPGPTKTTETGGQGPQDIADAIVTQLGRADADVTITMEIEAIADGGFSDDVRRTVSENARTLKFETHEFED